MFVSGENSGQARRRLNEETENCRRETSVGASKPQLRVEVKPNNLKVVIKPDEVSVENRNDEMAPQTNETCV